MYRIILFLSFLIQINAKFHCKETLPQARSLLAKGQGQTQGLTNMNQQRAMVDKLHNGSPTRDEIVKRTSEGPMNSMVIEDVDAHDIVGTPL